MELILIIFLTVLFFQIFRLVCVFEIKVKWFIDGDMRYNSYDIPDMMFYGSPGVRWFNIPKDENYRVI